MVWIEKYTKSKWAFHITAVTCYKMVSKDLFPNILFPISLLFPNILFPIYFHNIMFPNILFPSLTEAGGGILFFRWEDRCETWVTCLSSQRGPPEHFPAGSTAFLWGPASWFVRAVKENFLFFPRLWVYLLAITFYFLYSEWKRNDCIQIKYPMILGQKLL